MESLRVCKKCLLSDISEEVYLEKIADYVKRIDPEVKAPDEIYRKRLVICKDCERLISGVCQVCGCFVEVRAAVSKNYCPDVERKW